MQTNLKTLVILPTAFFVITTANSQSVIRRQTLQKETTASKPSQPKASYSDGTLNVNGVTYDMVCIIGGPFTMGASTVLGASDYEKPDHHVMLSKDYYLGKTEVTQALWAAVMGNNPSEFKGNNRPVECVSWDDCKRFISKLNTITGLNFRLPTEAEWEYAARGGNKSNHYLYSGSNNLDEVAWYDRNSGNRTHDVATRWPNELGIYDMSGNVQEWCSDYWGPYSNGSQTNPKGPSSGTTRVVRGGNWFYGTGNCRVSYRNSRDSNYKYGHIGFRLAISAL